LNLVHNMLDKALERLKEGSGLTIHSDQGWQYQHLSYCQKLESRGIKQSMSRKGNCLDNAAMESFFGTLKSEFFHVNRFTCIEELSQGIKNYIHYYNHKRIKLALNGLSPVAYREQAARAAF